MADTKISALTDGATAEADDQIPIARPTIGNRYITSTYLRTFIRTLANTWTRTQTFTPQANTSGIVISGGSLTGTDATAFQSTAGTWNTTGTPNARLVDITDSMSNAASRLDSLKVGGSEKWGVRKDGVPFSKSSLQMGPVQLLGSSSTVSGGAITISSLTQAAYHFRIVGSQISCDTATQSVQVEASADNGSTWPLSIQASASVGVSSLYPVSVTLYNAGDTASAKYLFYDGHANLGAVTTYATLASGSYINAVRIKPTTSGAIDGGTLYVFGF